MSVTIYTTPTCVYCKMAKEFFKKNNIEYKEIDVLQDMEGRKAMMDKSHQLGVPVIDINGEIIVGFNRPVIEKALQLGN